MNPLVTFFIELLEALFVIGVLGTVCVLAVAMVEDVEVILDKDKDEATPASPSE
jgi:hypothetical protein